MGGLDECERRFEFTVKMQIKFGRGGQVRGGQGACEQRNEVFVKNTKNKQIQRIYVPRQDFFKEIRNHLKM